jgi:DNA-binding transcriptional ArsR family regulator
MQHDRLSSTLAALADPTRRAIVARLATGQASVTELASPFTMSRPAISKHLRVLRQAGLIEQGRDARWRPCRLEPRPLKEVSDFIEQYRQQWEERYARLDVLLQELQTEDPRPPYSETEHSDDHA